MRMLKEYGGYVGLRTTRFDIDQAVQDSEVDCKLHGAAGRPRRGAVTNNPGLARAQSRHASQRRPHRRIVECNYLGRCQRFHAFRTLRGFPRWWRRWLEWLKASSAAVLLNVQSKWDPDEAWMNSFISL